VKRRYYDNDMNDDEYLYRLRTEEESRSHYANIKKTETKLKDEDEEFLLFNDDEDAY
jgi:hypothetical protein